MTIKLCKLSYHYECGCKKETGFVHMQNEGLHNIDYEQSKLMIGMDIAQRSHLETDASSC